MTTGCEPNYSLLLLWHSRWNDVVLDTSSLLINSTVVFFPLQCTLLLHCCFTPMWPDPVLLQKLALSVGSIFPGAAGAACCSTGMETKPAPRGRGRLLPPAAWPAAAITAAATSAWPRRCLLVLWAFIRPVVLPGLHSHPYAIWAAPTHSPERTTTVLSRRDSWCHRASWKPSFSASATTSVRPFS